MSAIYEEECVDGDPGDSDPHRILERLEDDVWQSANDLSTRAIVESVTEHDCRRFVDDRLVVDEHRHTRRLTETEAQRHDFSKYRRDAADRENHAPAEFVTGAYEYLLDDPTWETCTGCNGGGTVTCGRCSGGGARNCSTCRNGRARCSDCTGTGIHTKTVTCGRCNGRGLVDTSPEDSICADCGGEGQTREDVTCKYCEGDGTVTCDTCDGSGEVTCESCGGDGITTCDTCGGGGRLRTFDVLERTFEHVRDEQYVAEDVDEGALAGAEGTERDVRTPVPEASNVVKRRITEYEVPVVEVEYAYGGDQYTVLEVDGTDLEADSYPKNAASRALPYVAVVVAVLAVLAVYLVLL